MSRQRNLYPLSLARKTQILGLVLAILAVFYTTRAIDYGISISDGTVGAGALPFALGVLLAVFSVLLIMFPGTNTARGEDERQKNRAEVADAARFFVAITAYAALVTLIGFPLGTLAAVPLVMRRIFYYSWGPAVLVGAAMAGGGYVLFTYLLGVQMP